MASTINASTSSGIVQTADTSGVLQLQTASTTAVTIDSSQNVTLNNVIPSGSTAPTNGMFLPAANSIGLSTASTERMRIDSSGNVLVGTTSTLFASSHDFVNSGAAVLGLRNSTATAGLYWQVGPDNFSSFKVFNASSVGVFLANGSTAWSSSSDETLKENLEPITDAITKVNSLRTVIGNFIADESKTKHPFLIAQDVEKVLPEAISKAPDGTLGLAYTETIPLLVAAIQEQQALITSLTARITALEGAK